MNAQSSRSGGCERNDLLRLRAMFDVIAFDADDTLWHNEEYYTQAKEVFIRILSRYHSPKWVEQRLDEIEIHNVQA